MSTAALEQFFDRYQSYIYENSEFPNKTLIGKGGSGSVYSSFDQRTKKMVAVKELNIVELNKYGIRRYTTEIQTMLSCNSPFLVQFVGFTKTYPFTILTEYQQNGSLDNYMRNDHGKTLTPTALSCIVLGISMGVKSLHEKHIIHRDLKPSNILLDDKLYPRICDMGISRFCDELDPSPKTSMLGTPAYTAPEVLKDENYDNKVDIFSFGMLLYFICEGKNGFTGTRNFQEYYQTVYVKNQRPEFKKTSDVLRKIIKKCWDNDPNVRPSATEIVDYLCENYGELFPYSDQEEIASFLKTFASETKKQTKFDRTIDNEFSFNQKPSQKLLSDSSNFSGNSTVDSTYCSGQEFSSTGFNDESFDSLNSLDLSNPNSQSMTQGHYDGYLASLRDPDSPGFDEAIEFCRTKLSPFESVEFEKVLYNYLSNPNIDDVLRDKIIVTGVKMIYRDRKFLEYFAAHDFMKCLPLKGKLVERTIVVLSMLFILRPEMLKNEYVPVIVELLRDHPARITPLFYHYVNKSNEMENALDGVKSIIELSRVFVDEPQGFDLIRCLYIFYLKGEITPEAKNDIVNNFLYFLNSQNFKNVIIAYKVLLGINIDLSIIDINVIISHLKNPNLWRHALSALLRLPQIDPTPTLVSSLIDIFEYDKPEVLKAWLVLYRVAEIEQFSQLLMSNLKWFSYYSRYTKECFSLFLILFSHPTNRYSLSKNQNFCNLMNSAIHLNDKVYTSAIISILIRCPITEETIQIYSSTSLLRAIIFSCNSFNDPLYQYKGMVLLEKISRNGIFTREFLDYLDVMISLLPKQEYYLYAIIALTSMSFHKQCADILKQNQSLIQYFESVKKSSPEFQGIAKKFLSHM